MALFWGAIVFWISAWSINIWIARQKEKKILNLFPPILFGVSVIFIWQATVVHFEVSPIILPPPSAIYFKFISSTSILWEDFVQTVVKGALSGYFIGCGVAFAVSLIADKFKFFERGVLPIGNFLAAMPILGSPQYLLCGLGLDGIQKLRL